jgi:hypothetical protein
VAPRDFIDATCHHPEETQTIRYLSQIEDDHDLLKTGKPRFWKAFEDTIADLSSIYCQRLQYAWRCNQIISGVVDAWHCNHVIPGAFESRPFQPNQEPLPQPPWLTDYLAMCGIEDVRPGEWIVRPYWQKPSIDPDNTREYRMRYLPFKRETFDSQFAYLVKTLSLARQQNTHVVMVNMPLQSENMQLLQKGVYNMYLQELAQITESESAEFIDLNRPGLFQPSDFSDYVHLNGIGGLKFFNYLSEGFQHNHYM